MNDFILDHNLPEYVGPFKDVIPKYLLYRDAQGLKYSHRLAQQLRRMDKFFLDLGITEPCISREAYEAYTARSSTEKKGTVEVRRSAIRPFARYLESLGYENIYTGYDDHRPFKTSYIPYIYSIYIPCVYLKYIPYIPFELTNINTNLMTLISHIFHLNIIRLISGP